MMSEFDDFKKIVAKIKTQYPNRQKSAWKGSPFAWIKLRASKTIGTIGEKLVAEWATSKGFTVSRTGDSEADRVIQHKRIEIKFSTLWDKKNIYKFQQIRDQNYEYCFCLGVSPGEVHAWLIPKDVLMRPQTGLSPQHGGKKGVDTYWLAFEPSLPPRWLKKYGGSLAQVEKLFRKL